MQIEYYFNVLKNYDALIDQKILIFLILKLKDLSLSCTDAKTHYDVKYSVEKIC
jgi:hypothetical protein